MRAKKRLKFTREEHPAGVVYRAKRKRELALVVPRPEGGYDLVYKSEKCKRKITTTTLAEAREAAEAIRSTPQRNPLGIRKPSPTFLWGAGIGAALAVGIYAWLEARANTATQPPAVSGAPTGTPPATVAPASANPPQVAPLAADEDTQNLTWNGGAMSLALPLNVGTAWVSVNGSTAGVPATGDLALPANPVGTYEIVYATASGNVTTTVNVTALPGAT